MSKEEEEGEYGRDFPVEIVDRWLDAPIRGVPPDKKWCCPQRHCMIYIATGDKYRWAPQP